MLTRTSSIGQNKFWDICCRSPFHTAYYYIVMLVMLVCSPSGKIPAWSKFNLCGVHIDWPQIGVASWYCGCHHFKSLPSIFPTKAGFSIFFDAGSMVACLCGCCCPNFTCRHLLMVTHFSLGWRTATLWRRVTLAIAITIDTLPFKYATCFRQAIKLCLPQAPVHS